MVRSRSLHRRDFRPSSRAFAFLAFGACLLLVWAVLQATA
jgi:hypothetical protein